MGPILAKGTVAMFLLCALPLHGVLGIIVPSTTPNTSAPIDPAQLSVSIEFFAFPGYTEISPTATCLANLEELRGVAPAVRIGGTTQYAKIVVFLLLHPS